MAAKAKRFAHGRDAAAILVFVLVLLLAVYVSGFITDKGGEHETRIVRDAVHDAAVTCYAVEGSYPDSLEYLRKHYGLAFDEDRYLVSYDAFASNLMPDITVLELKK